MAHRHVLSPARGLSARTKRRFITDLVTVKVSGEETGDVVTVMEIETPPGGGVPPHTQRYEDEVIYVLDGTYSLVIGDNQEEISEGDTRFVPRGVRHGFANPGPAAGRMLVHMHPGGIQEQLIAETGDDPGRPIWESDLGRVVSMAPAFGTEFDVDDI